MLLKACLNGGRAKADHPAVPVTPDELAADAERVVDAGADAIHIHPRAPDGPESLEPAAVSAAVAAVRAAVPTSVPIGVTTGAWIEPDLRRRLDLIAGWDERPDFASVNVSEDGWEEVASGLLSRGIDVEAGTSTREDAAKLVDSALAPRFLRVLVETSGPDAATAVNEADEIGYTLNHSRVWQLGRVYHGFGPATWDVIRWAIAERQGIRVGLEDTFTLPDGSPAPDNAALVAAARELIG